MFVTLFLTGSAIIMPRASNRELAIWRTFSAFTVILIIVPFPFKKEMEMGGGGGDLAAEMKTG